MGRPTVLGRRKSGVVEVVDDLSHVPNEGKIEIADEGMVTTPTDELEGDIVVSDDKDHDPVTPKE